MKSSFKQHILWGFKFFGLYLLSFQMAFGSIITRIPASERYTYSIDQLLEENKSFYKKIHGYDSEPNCEVVEAESYDLSEEAVQTNSSQSLSIEEHEDFINFFFEEVTYILTSTDSGTMTKEEVVKEILTPAYQKGLKRNEIEDILDETAHLANFQEAFLEQVAEVEGRKMAEKYIREVGNNTRETWENVLANMKKNACGTYITRTNWHDKAAEKGSAEQCNVVHIKGDVDKFSEKMMSLEEKDQVMGHLNESDPHLNRRYKEARKLQQEVNKYIADNSVPMDLRQEIFVNYLESVALPFRDLVIARRSYVKDELSLSGYYDSLLSKVPVSLIGRGKADFIKKIKDGTNSYFASNSLKLIREVYEGKAGSYVTGYRLEYDKTKIFYRDLKTLMHAPTKRNYVQALKWMTLAMMASQGLTYNTILGKDQKGFDLPKACHGDDNSDLPKNFWMSDDGMNRSQMLDSIVDNLRIIPGYEEQSGSRAKAVNATAVDTYISNTSGNPYENGYAGISPLERYVWADYGLNKKTYHLGRVEFDDRTDFTSVIQQKMPAIMEVYEQERKTRAARSSKGRKSRKYTLTYKDIDELQMMFKPVPKDLRYEVDGEGSFVGSIYNLSEFLADRMQREGVTTLEELIEPIKEKFSKVIKHPFPGFHGSTIWKQMALSDIAKFAQRHQAVSRKSKIYQVVERACTKVEYSGGNYSYSTNTSTRPFCAGESNHFIENIFNKLKYFLTQEKYVALKKYEELGLKSHWNALSSIWIHLRDQSQALATSRETEYKFLMRSLKAGNKWAMSRIGYVYFMEELSDIRAQYDPEYSSTRRGRRLNRNSYCYIRNIDKRILNLQKVGKELRLNKPIARFHGTKILSKDEKKSLFQTIISQFNNAQTSMGLFTAEIKGTKVFQHLNNIGYENLFSKDKLTKFSKKNFGEDLSDAAKEELSKYEDTHEARITDFFVEILNPEKDQRSFDQRLAENEELFKKFFVAYGDPAKFNSRESLVLRDNQYKRIIAKDIIRHAVKSKQEELNQAMSDFCGLDKDNHEGAKAVFYAASQNQVQLNQLLGLDNEVLQKINENINALSKEEKQDIWIGLGLAGLSMAAILIGSLCTAATGGLCAPLGVAMMTAGVGALTLQFNLFNRELSRKMDADKYEAYVGRMEKLGFANEGSADAISRWWTWTIIEGLGFIPLFNIVFKSVGAGSKVVASTSRAFFRQIAKGGTKWENVRKAWKVSGRAGSIAYKEWDIKIAHALLGISNVDDAIDGGLEVAERVQKSTKAAQEAADNLKKLRSLHDAGKMSLREVMRQVSKQLENLSTAAIKNYDDTTRLRSLITKVDVRQLNRATAKQMASYWGGNTDEFLKFFKSYWGKWAFAPNAAYRGDRIKFAVDMVAKANKKEFWFGKNWWVKLRFGHLADVADEMVSMRRHLETLQSTGKLSINGRVVTTLEDYILENLEEVSKVFIKMPVRKREMPFMFLWLGGPEVTSPTLARITGVKWFKGGKSLRYGGMHWMGNGIAMKKLINSRAILLSEIQQNVVNTILKVPQDMAPQLFTYSLTRFSQSMDLVAESLIRQETEKLGMKNIKDMVKYFGIKEDQVKAFIELVSKSKTAEEFAEEVGKLGLSIKKHNQLMKVYEPIFKQRAQYLAKMNKLKYGAAEMARAMMGQNPRLRDDFIEAAMAIFDTLRRKDGTFKHIFKIFPSMFSAASKVLSPTSKKEVIKLLSLDVDTLVKIMWEPATDAEAMLAEAIWKKIKPSQFIKGIPDKEFAHEAGGILLKEMDAFKNRGHQLLEEVGADEAFNMFFDYYLNAVKVQTMQKSPGFIDYF